MKIEIIIPTYNGRSRIPNLLKSLCLQSYKSFSVIVVIDGSIDNTNAIVEKFKEELDLSSISIPNVGRAGARNAGAKIARPGSLLIFIDDDMVVESDFVLKHRNHQLQYKGSLVTGPQIKYEEHFTEYGIYERKKNLRIIENEFPLYINLLKAPYLTAANFSILKEKFDMLGGFDERLSDGEDYDLAVRAFHKKMKIYFVRIYADHKDGLNCEGFIKRSIEYRRAGNRLCELKPEIYESDTQLKSRLNYPKYKYFFLFWTFSHESLVLMLDKGRFQWIPTKFRYKLYDVIITANVLKKTIN